MNSARHSEHEPPARPPYSAWFTLIASLIILAGYFFAADNSEQEPWNWKGVVFVASLAALGVSVQLLLEGSKTPVAKSARFVAESVVVVAVLGFSVEIPHVSKILKEGLKNWLEKTIAEQEIPKEAFSDGTGLDWKYIVIREDKQVSHGGTSTIGLSNNADGQDSLLNRVSISGFRICALDKSTNITKTFGQKDHPWHSQMIARIASDTLVIGFVYQFEKSYDIIGYGKLTDFEYDKQGPDHKIIKMSGEYRQLAPNSVRGKIIFSRDSHTHIDLKKCRFVDAG